MIVKLLAGKGSADARGDNEAARGEYCVHGQRTEQNTWDSEGRLLTPPACWEKSLTAGIEGVRFQLDPFLTLFGGSILKWVTLEF